MLEYICINCNLSKEVEFKHKGKKVRCPVCKNINTVGNVPSYNDANIFIDKCQCGNFFVYDKTFYGKSGYCSNCSKKHTLYGLSFNSFANKNDSMQKNKYTNGKKYFSESNISIIRYLKNLIAFGKSIHNIDPDDKENYIIKRFFIDVIKYGLPVFIFSSILLMLTIKFHYSVIFGFVFGLLFGILRVTDSDFTDSSDYTQYCHSNSFTCLKFWKFYGLASTIKKYLSIILIKIGNFLSMFKQIMLKSISSAKNTILPFMKNLYINFEKVQEQTRHANSLKSSSSRETIRIFRSDTSINNKPINEEMTNDILSIDQIPEDTGNELRNNSFPNDTNNSMHPQASLDILRDEDIYRHFIKENSDYYIKQFKSFNRNDSIVSWNWAAFIFTIFWLAYRRMYLYCAVGIFLNIITGFTINLILWLLFGLFGNYLYFTYTKTKINKSFDTYKDKATVLKNIDDYVIGGVSVAAVINLFMVFALIMMLFFGALASFFYMIFSL